MSNDRRGQDTGVRCLAVLALVVVLAGSLLVPRAAFASSPAEVCRKLGTSDQLRAIPRSLVPAAVRLFGLSAMPVEQVERSTVYRCFEGRVFVCNYGANLPCGKADTSRYLPGANAWCAGHPGSDFIPMYVTGHDTIYRWRCDGDQAVAGAAVFSVDARGFITRFWKPADP